MSKLDSFVNWHVRGCHIGDGECTCGMEEAKAELAQLRERVNWLERYIGSWARRERLRCDKIKQLRAELALSELATEEQIKINSALLQRLDKKYAALKEAKKYWECGMPDFNTGQVTFYFELATEIDDFLEKLSAHPQDDK